jgi:hypothetical protein
MRLLLVYMLLAGWAAAASAAAPVKEVVARLDDAVAAEWKKQDLIPEATADDATFCRRVWLDLAGHVPPPLRARAFLDDRDPAKRARLVEVLLSGDEFADHWGSAWAQRLTGKRPVPDGSYDGRVLHQYLRDAVRANRPYRAVVTDLIAGEGLSDSSGPANFLLSYQAKPTDLVAAVSKHFLGVTLQCAQCHDHPHAKWKKEDFWGVAAFFARTRVLQGEGLTGVFEARRGELELPDPAAKPAEDGKVPMKPVAPRLPDARNPDRTGKRRQALAAWVTADDNLYFARNAVNQVWGQLFGKPLLGSLDRPTSERQRLAVELLDILAADFRASGQDIQRLVRILALSRVYQLGTGDDSPTPAADEAKEKVRYRQMEALARFRVRPLTVDQLYQSIAQATGYRGPDAPAAAPESEEGDGADMPVNFLGERGQTVQRALALLNGEYVHKAVAAGARAARAVNGGRVGADHIEWLFLTTLSRRPTTEESAAMLGLLKEEAGPTRGLENVLWALVNSAEFNTNH